jgi:sugar O-acyltransferase (sialic acid O-acetyltransferase NeuD family)
MDDSRRLILVGCGGHGRVVMESLILTGHRIDGIVDPNLPAGVEIDGATVMGGDELLDEQDRDRTRVVVGVGRVPRKTDHRRRLFEQLASNGWEIIGTTHPSATVSRSAKLGAANQLLAGAVVQRGVRTGVNCVINTRASIDHDGVLADHVFVGPGATLCGDVIVGASAFIGAGAVILPGITIGEDAVVAAGTLVARDVPAGAVVAGNPARAMKETKS